jgi:hypothetical protein
MNQNDNVVACVCVDLAVMIAASLRSTLCSTPRAGWGWTECPGAVVQSEDERNADDLEDGTLREVSRVRRPGV